MSPKLACAIISSLWLLGCASHTVYSDKDSLQGQWMAVAGQFDGKKSKLTDDELRAIKLIIKDNRLIMRFPPGDVFGSAVATQREYEFALDETKNPKTIDLVVKDKEDRGKNILASIRSTIIHCEYVFPRTARIGRTCL